MIQRFRKLLAELNAPPNDEPQKMAQEFLATTRLRLLPLGYSEQSMGNDWSSDFIAEKSYFRIGYDPKESWFFIRMRAPGTSDEPLPSDTWNLSESDYCCENVPRNPPVPMNRDPYEVKFNAALEEFLRAHTSLPDTNLHTRVSPPPSGAK